MNPGENSAGNHSDNEYYYGEFKDGFYHGEGELEVKTRIYEDTHELENKGFTYNGSFIEGVHHGYGILVYDPVD